MGKNSFPEVLASSRVNHTRLCSLTGVWIAFRSAGARREYLLARRLAGRVQLREPAGAQNAFRSAERPVLACCGVGVLDQVDAQRSPCRPIQPPSAHRRQRRDRGRDCHRAVRPRAGLESVVGDFPQRSFRARPIDVGARDVGKLWLGCLILLVLVFDHGVRCGIAAGRLERAVSSDRLANRELLRGDLAGHHHVGGAHQQDLVAGPDDADVAHDRHRRFHIGRQLDHLRRLRQQVGRFCADL